MHSQLGSISALKHIARRQAINVRKLISGLPVQVPSFGSMTLEKDDVALAQEQLAKPETWQDEEAITTYENTFANWNGSKAAFAFMGGRVALSAAIYALDLQPGDEVIIPGYTCVVVPNAFHYAGVDVTYADIELETYGLSAESFASRISPRTKAVLIHHLFGLVCRDYEQILAIARKHQIKVIEDCAHATGARFKGANVGNAGDVAFYSSELSKVFNTIKGGMAVTNDPALEKRLQIFKDEAPLYPAHATEKLLYNVAMNYYRSKHSQRWLMGDLYWLKHHRKEVISTTAAEIDGVKPQHYNSRMPAPVARLGLNQLQKIERFNNLRTKQAKKWDMWCDQNGYTKPLVLPDSQPVWLRYPVLVAPEKKRNTTWLLRELGIQAGVWFVSHLHPKAGHIADCPNCDIAVARCINLATLV